jgi:hypothetical protein
MPELFPDEMNETIRKRLQKAGLDPADLAVLLASEIALQAAAENVAAYLDLRVEDLQLIGKKCSDSA